MNDGDAPGRSIEFDLRPVDSVWDGACALVECALEFDASVANAVDIAATLLHVAASVLLRTPWIVGLRSEENFVELVRHVFKSTVAQTSPDVD